MDFYITNIFGIARSILARIEVPVMQKLYEDFNPKITNEYARIIEHKDGGQYAVAIMDLTWFDIKALMTPAELGDIIPAPLPEDWFEEIP